jgi:mycofactocin radical SAM maturase
VRRLLARSPSPVISRVLEGAQAQALAPRVSMRREPFGALLYHFGTRRLIFLKDRRLADVVEALAVQPRLEAACEAAGVGRSEMTRYGRAIEALCNAGMLVGRWFPPGGGARGPGAGERGAAIGKRSRLGSGELKHGLRAPICLTWELTYACNLACTHCLSSSGRRDPAELSTAEAKALIDEFERMQVFYVNIGGGEPTIRSDFWDLVGYATEHHVGVKFSTNGSRIDRRAADRIAADGYLDVQVSLDGATPEVNDEIRGEGSFVMAVRALEHLAAAGACGVKLSVVVTRRNIPQLDQLKAMADRYGAQLRLTRLRPSGRGAEVWHELHPTAEQQRLLHSWLVFHGDGVLTGDSFFHLSALGEALPGLNMCGAGRVVCLIDPVGDVYACPFAVHESFLAGNVRELGFAHIWAASPTFAGLRGEHVGQACSSCPEFGSCGGGCMAAKFFTGLPLDGPDPECVMGAGAAALRSLGSVSVPRSCPDHSRLGSPKKEWVQVGMPIRRTHLGAAVELVNVLGFKEKLRG